MATTAYKVKTGFHSTGVKVYRKGQVFESDKPLHKMFPNKFEIVANGKVPKKTKAAKNTKQARYNQVQALEELGKNVSQKFPDAINQGLVVYQNEDGEYNIATDSDLFTALNKKPLTRAGVKRFVMNR